MTMTATTTDHIAIVSDLYAAFGRGDLAGMLAPLAVDTAKHIAAWNGEDTTRRPGS
jgi:ketosteroid isomerase-like protein